MERPLPSWFYQQVRHSAPQGPNEGTESAPVADVLRHLCPRDANSVFPLPNRFYFYRRCAFVEGSGAAMALSRLLAKGDAPADKGVVLRVCLASPHVRVWAGPATAEHGMYLPKRLMQHIMSIQHHEGLAEDPLCLLALTQQERDEWILWAHTTHPHTGAARVVPKFQEALRSLTVGSPHNTPSARVSWPTGPPTVSPVPPPPPPQVSQPPHRVVAAHVPPPPPTAPTGLAGMRYSIVLTETREVPEPHVAFRAVVDSHDAIPIPQRRSKKGSRVPSINNSQVVMESTQRKDESAADYITRVVNDLGRDGTAWDETAPFGWGREALPPRATTVEGHGLETTPDDTTEFRLKWAREVLNIHPPPRRTAPSVPLPVVMDEGPQWSPTPMDHFLAMDHKVMAAVMSRLAGLEVTRCLFDGAPLVKGSYFSLPDEILLSDDIDVWRRAVDREYQEVNDAIERVCQKMK